MSKTVFDHLTEQLDSVVKGRRYIIAEIGKLKVSVEDLRDVVDKSAGGGNDMGQVVNDLKTFMQRTIGTLGDLKNTVGQLAGVVKNLASQVQVLQQSGVRAAPASASATTPVAAPAQVVTPTPTAAPTYAQPRTSVFPSASTPAAAPTPAPTQTPAAPGSAAASAFDRILQVAKSGTASKDLGGMLDALRTSLSKANPLNPILFELSMEAGRLKSMGANPLDASGIGTFEQKINKWKSKS